MTTLHFFHRYDRLSASFRARCECYAPYLERAGIPFRFHSLLDSRYLSEKYATGKTSKFGVLNAYLKQIRALLTLGKRDVAIVHLELFPYWPGVFVRFLTFRGVRLVYDFDDPFFHFYDQHRSGFVRALFGNKIRKIIRMATAVIAGNRYLAAYAAEEKRDAVIIPSVVDLERYSTVKACFDPAKPFTIGWIGTPSTVPHLRAAQKALTEFCSNRNARIVLVGSGTTGLEDFPAEIRPWSEATEVSDILEFDVGVMPLPDTPFNRGKGAMKIMQYMACGIPTIASPVGFNTEIVQHGKNGFLAESHDDWIRCLTTLYDQRELCRALGAEGRKTMEREFCLQVTAPRFVDFAKHVMQTPMH